MSDTPRILLSDSTETSRVQWWKKITLEPVMFLIFFIMTLSGTIFSNQVIYRTCISMQFNKTDCDLLGTPNASDKIRELEQMVQPGVASFILVSTIAGSLPAAIVSFFVGPWSDTYGRKPLVFFPLVGYVLQYMGYFCIIWLLPDISPYWFLLTYIPTGLSGGTGAIITGVFGFLTDSCNENNRATRMGVMEATIFIGLLAGTSLSAPLFKQFGYLGIYGTAVSSLVIGVLYVWFVMKETVRSIPQEKSRFKAIFDCNHIKILILVCLKKRDGYNRAILWMVTFALGSSVLTLYGMADVNYLFTREQLHWTLPDFTTFNSIALVLSILGAIIGISVFHKCFRMSETVLCIIALFSSMVEVLIRAVATSTWHMYLGSAVSILRAVFSPMARSILAKVATSADIGKAYSLATTAEALSPIAAGPMYMALYKATLETYPGAFNLMTAAIYLINLLLLIAIFIMQRKSSKHDDTTPINQDTEYSVNSEFDDESDHFGSHA